MLTLQEIQDIKDKITHKHLQPFGQPHLSPLGRIFLKPELQHWQRRMPGDIKEVRKQKRYFN
jgi:hypothetical protein